MVSLLRLKGYGGQAGVSVQVSPLRLVGYGGQAGK